MYLTPIQLTKLTFDVAGFCEFQLPLLWFQTPLTRSSFSLYRSMWVTVALDITVPSDLVTEPTPGSAGYSTLNLEEYCELLQLSALLLPADPAPGFAVSELLSLNLGGFSDFSDIPYNITPNLCKAMILIFKHAATLSLSGIPVDLALTQAESDCCKAKIASKVEKQFTASYQEYSIIEQFINFLRDTNIGLCIGLGSGIIYVLLLGHIARFKAKQQT
ncbi:hypothetical protein V8E53_001451 [Lactarius tabidus]